MSALRALWRDEAGIVYAETAMLIAFVALAGIGLWQHFGQVATTPTDQTVASFAEEPATKARPLVRQIGYEYARPQ